MLQRMRQGAWAGLRVDWGTAGTTEWELPIQQRAFGGDTLLALGGFAGVALAQLAGVRLLARGPQGQELELGRICTTAEAQGDDLPRIAAARRVAALDAASPPDGMAIARRKDEAVQHQEPAAQAQAVALQYRLISRHTHGVLVHKRSDADKPKDESLLHRVQSMLAAGWGNTGRVVGSQAMRSSAGMKFSVSSPGGLKIAASAMRSSASNSCLSTPSVWRSARTSTHSLMAATMDMMEIPAFLRKQADSDDDALVDSDTPRYTALAEMSGAIADHLARGGLVQDLPTLAQGFQTDPALEPAYRHALEELRDITDDEPSVWLLLALWIAQRPGPEGSPAMAAVLVGPVTQAGLTPSDIGQAWRALQQHLGQVSSQAPSSAKPSRKQRLAAALSDAGD
jgi:hypothetical protein